MRLDAVGLKGYIGGKLERVGKPCRKEIVDITERSNKLVFHHQNGAEFSIYLGTFWENHAVKRLNGEIPIGSMMEGQFVIHKPKKAA